MPYSTAAVIRGAGRSGAKSDIGKKVLALAVGMVVFWWPVRSFMMVVFAATVLLFSGCGPFLWGRTGE